MKLKKAEMSGVESRVRASRNHFKVLIGLSEPKCFSRTMDS